MLVTLIAVCVYSHGRQSSQKWAGFPGINVDMGSLLRRAGAACKQAIAQDKLSATVCYVITCFKSDWQGSVIPQQQMTNVTKRTRCCLAKPLIQNREQTGLPTYLQAARGTVYKPYVTDRQTEGATGSHQNWRGRGKRGKERHRGKPQEDGKRGKAVMTFVLVQILKQAHSAATHVASPCTCHPAACGRFCFFFLLPHRAPAALLLDRVLCMLSPRMPLSGWVTAAAAAA